MTSSADAAAQTTGASLFRGGLWTGLAHFLPQLYTLAVSIAAARYLGPDDFGRQSFLAFVGLSIQLVLASGIGLALMRSVAEALGRRSPDRARGMLRWAWQVQLAASMLGAGVLLAVAAFGASPGAAWALVAATTAIGVLHSVPNAALLGAQRFREAALVGLATGSVAVPATIAVLAAGGGIVGIFAVEAAVGAVNLGLTVLLARRVFRGLATETTPAPDLQRRAVRFAALSTLSALVSLVVWRRSEFFFLAYYSTDVQIGLYSIAFAAVSALTLLFERLATVVVSAFATLHGAEAGARIRMGFGRALRLLVILALPITAGAIPVGPELLREIYGSDYSGTGPVLMVLAAVMPLTAISVVASSLLSGLGDAKSPLLAGVVAAIVNVALAFLLIPPLDAVGAALANVGGQVAATAVLLVSAHRAVGGVLWGTASLARTAVAAAACGAASWGVLQVMSGPGSVAAAVLAGTAVFAVVALALRIFSAEDGAWLDANLGRQLGGRMGEIARRATWRPKDATT